MRRILCIGDVVASAGCEFLREKLPVLKSERKIDLVMANGENSANGNGILPYSASFLLDSGVDVITGGNHSFRRREIYSYLDETECVIRPANFPCGTIGKGCFLYDGGSFRVLFINLMGLSYMEPLSDPFDTMESLLKQFETPFTVVDFHAEATGEKRALGYYLDGRISLFVGTHTHVQTADEQILPNGTGYITDLGMTGPIASVLGVKPEQAIERYKTKLPTRFETAVGPCRMDGIVADIDEKSGKCLAIERISIR